MQKFVAENVRVGFDFSLQDELASFGETLSSISFVGAFVYGTYNPITKTGQLDPNLILNGNGAPAISGSQVLVWVSGGSSGATYHFVCLAVTSAGKTIESRFVLGMLD